MFIPRWPFRLIHILDAFTLFTGRCVSWLTVAMVVVGCLVVVLRYVFDSGSIALQESLTYLHALVFLLGAAYTLQSDGHVRVDIFYRRFSAPQQAWVECLGTLVFLLPVCVFIGLMSWDYVANSWAIQESSVDAGGIPAIFLLKTLIPIAALTLVIQGIAHLLRNLLILMGAASASSFNARR